MKRALKISMDIIMNSLFLFFIVMCTGSQLVLAKTHKIAVATGAAVVMPQSEKPTKAAENLTTEGVLKGKTNKELHKEEVARKKEDEQQRKGLKEIRTYIEKEGIKFAEDELIEAQMTVPTQTSADGVTASMPSTVNVDSQVQVLSKEERDAADQLNQAHAEKDKNTAREILRKEKSNKKHGILEKRRNAEVRVDTLEQEEKASKKALRDAENQAGKYEFLYAVPAWPIQAIYHRKNDYFNVSLSYREATKGYSAHGKKQNVSRLVFGENQILVQDILLASRLTPGVAAQPSALVSGGALSVNGNPTSFLKNAVIEFNGSFSEIKSIISYSHLVKDYDLSFGFDLPIMRRENNLKMSVRPTDASKQLIGNSVKARDLGGTAESFVVDILAKKGISLLAHDAVSGIGDLSLFGQFRINSSKCENLTLGACAVFPTAQNRDPARLWAPELGNGGFHSLGLFGSVLAKYKKCINPHVYGQMNYFIPTSLMRRLPRFIRTSAGQDLPANSFVNQDELISVALRAGDFNSLDAIVRGFSDKVTKINIQKGFEAQLQVGNIFEHLFFRRDYLDLFYFLRFKGEDSLGSSLAEDLYDPSVLFVNTSEVEHTLGFEHSYQFDRNVRLKINGRYTFAGINVPELFEVGASVSVEF